MQFSIYVIMLAFFIGGARNAAAETLILKDVRILSEDFQNFSPAEHLVLKDGQIAKRSSNWADLQAQIKQDARVIDGKGLFLLPGLVEAHGHLLNLGKKLTGLDLSGLNSKAEVLQAIKEFAKGHKETAWIVGRGWDQNLWKNRQFPTRDDLDGLGLARPIALTRVDGHAMWIDSKAMRLAGLHERQDNPAGGRLVRDENGRFTGILVDRAMDLIAAKMPEPRADQKKSWLLAAMQYANQNGLTAFHDAGTDAETLQLLQSMQAQQHLSLRLYVMLQGRDAALLDRYYKLGPQRSNDGLLHVKGVKLMVDGALGSRGAALLEDYSDEPGHRGLMLLSPSELNQQVSAAVKAGFQPAVHAIGDKANRVVLDSFQQARSALKPMQTKDVRWRIEHAQILDETDIARFQELGVVASMQPLHCTSDRPWVPQRIGDQRTAEGAYVWQSLQQRGVALAFGSDVPVESLNPFAGLYAAITRQQANGLPKGGFDPKQRLSLAQALRAYIEGGAYASFAEQSQGRVAVGYDADLILIDRDLTRISPEQLAATKVMMTIVGGNIVFKRPVQSAAETLKPVPQPG